MKALDDYQRLAALIAATSAITPQRLQKLVYVLEALGAPFRYRYQMHFGEPYSEDLEADINLLTTLNFIAEDEEPKTQGTLLRANPLAAEYLRSAEELRQYLPVIAELTSADAKTLDFAATFGAWRQFNYETRDALQQAFRSTDDRRIDAEGESILRRLGLLAKG